MKQTESIIDRLLGSVDDRERKKLLTEFEKPSPSEKSGFTRPFIDLISSDDTIKESIRSWFPSFLGLIGTSEIQDVLMNRLQVEKAGVVRSWIIKTPAGNFKNPERIDFLIGLVDHEENYLARRSVARMLSEINDEKTVSKLIEFLDDTDRHIRGYAATGLMKLRKARTVEPLIRQLAAEDVEEVKHKIMEALIVIGHPKTIPDLVGILKDETQMAQFNVSIIEALGRLGKEGDEIVVGVLLDKICHDSRVIAVSAEAVKYLKTLQEDPKLESGAGDLLEEIGGAEAGKGFSINLYISLTIFILGVSLLGVGIYMMVFRPEVQWLGGGSGLAGLGTVLAMFYRGPADRIERAVTNLVQTEIAFLGYIRQVTQITAMFERKYLDDKSFTLADLKEMLNYTEHAMKETMPLMNLYTAVTMEKNNSQKN